MDPQRVCQLHVRGTGDFGSGYRLTETLVLTVRHNVESEELPRVRPLGGDWVDSIKIIRTHTADLALVRIPAADGVAPVRLGRFTAGDRVACQALGFPRAQAGERTRGTEEVAGEVAPLTKRDDGLLTIHVSGSVPLDKELWRGFSGAAVFCGSILVGVARVAPNAYDSDRLLAVPMTALADEPELCEALGGRPALEPVEVALAGLTSEPAIANFLHQYVGSGRAFGGRGQELERLDRWLEDGPPYFLVTGRPGRGKSALLAEWYRARRTIDPLVYVPISIRYELNRELPVLRAIVTRLAALHGETVAADGVEDLRDALARLVARRPPSGRAALIVDGLDEASGWGVGPSLFPLAHDGGVKVLVSARLAGRRSAPEDWLRALGWDGAVADALMLDALTPEATADVVARAGLAPEVAAKVHEITEGDPLIVGLYVDHLRGSPDREAALAGAEPGLAGFMATWWEDQERQWGAGLADLGDDVRAAWNVLACARGPLERRDLLELVRRHRALTGDDLDRALKTLERLVVLEPPRSYAVSHPRLGKFRAGQLDVDGDLATYTSMFVEWGLERVAELTAGERAPADVSAYVVLHLREHLEAGRLAPETVLRLADPLWELAWDAKAGDTAGFVADIEYAASIADGEGAVWCAYLLASRLHTLSLVGPSFVAELVRHTVWSERRALDHAERIEVLYTRAEALAALAPHLSAAGVQRALDMIAEEPEGLAIGVLARRRVALGDLDGARADMESRPPGRIHARAALAILDVLPRHEQTSLLRTVAADLDDLRLETLDQLTRSVDRALAVEAFGDAPEQWLESQLRGEVHWWYERQSYADLDAVKQGYALSLLGRWLPLEDLAQRLTDVLDGLARGSGLNVADAIVHLAPLIGEPLLDRAELAIKARLKGESQARARIALACYGEPGRRDRLLDVDVPALVELSGADVDEAIASLTACGRGDAVVEAAIEAGSRRASDGLVAAAPHLDETLVRRALPAAATAAADGCDDGLTALLGRLASFGAAQTQEALGVAAATHNDELLRTATTALRHAGANEFDALGLITNPEYLLAAVSGSGRAGRLTAADLSATVAGFGNLREPNRHALEAFDVLHPLLDLGEQADPRLVATLTALIRFQPHQHKDRIVVAAMRRMVRASGPEPVLDLASEILAKDRFDAAVVWAIAAVAAESGDPTTADSLQRLAVQISEPVGAAVAKAALLRFLEDAEAEQAWEALFGEMTPDVVEFHSSSAALLVAALPRRFRERTVQRLVPDELLEGLSTYRSGDLWAAGVADLAPVLDRDQVRRLAARAGKRGALVAACAGRLVALGEVDEAVVLLDTLRRDYLAEALARCLDGAAAADVPRLILLAARRLDEPEHRAFLWARAGRRVDELSDSDATALLEAWLALRPSRDLLLVDLTLFAAPLARLGGDAAAHRLAARLDPGVTGMRTVSEAEQ